MKHTRNISRGVPPLIETLAIVGGVIGTAYKSVELKIFSAATAYAALGSIPSAYGSSRGQTEE